MRLQTTILLLTSLLSIELSAQLKKCGTYEEYSSAQKTSPKSYPRTTIEIPIVFHVVWNNNEENIDDRLIFSQLTIINQDYSALNPDLDLVPDEFKKDIGNPGIRFCLANTDEFGLPSSGIVRSKTTTNNIGNQSNIVNGERAIMTSSQGGSNPWDPKRYLNVWIGSRNDGVLGDATFPHVEGANTSIDGIVIDYRAIGRKIDNDAIFNLGRTLTHEIGHYLNLFHLSGSEGGCFNDGDFVDDTPTQFSEYFGSCSTPVFSCDSRDMDMNFMNFRDDKCLVFFTKGQVERMRESLFTSRYELINSNTCSANTPIPDDPLKIAQLRRFDDRLELSLTTLVQRNYTLSVFDITGREVLTTPQDPSHIYDFPYASYSSGVYILHLQLGESRWVRKVYID